MLYRRIYDERLASRGSDDGREAVMRPAGEHLDASASAGRMSQLPGRIPPASRDITAEGILET